VPREGPVEVLLALDNIRKVGCVVLASYFNEL
jgi:hypothetical protein